MAPISVDTTAELLISFCRSYRPATSNVIYFAVPQGKRVGETLDIIAKQGELNRSELEEAVKNYEQYGVPSNFPSIEGWLHPG